MISERSELTDNLNTYLKARDTRHCFGSQDIKLVCALTKFLSEDSAQFLASESHFFLLSGDWLVSQRGDFGQERFNEERRNFSLAVRRKINFLYENSPLHWNQDGSPSRFEDLCRELLGREPTVQRVRKVSPTMQPDQGRDLIAEIVSYVPVDIPVAEDAQPIHITKYVVQCKYANGTLGIPNGAGPYEVLYLGDYLGYFLITNSTISSSLTSLLEKIRSDKKYTADWWTRDEVEGRLKTHPDLLEKYSDLVSYTPFNGKIKRNRRQAKNSD